MNASPKHDEHEAGDLLEQELVAEERRRRRAAAPTPSSDEDGGEPEHERDARDARPAGPARLAEPVGLDRRDRRQVAGHERQDARREEREEAGEQRDRQLVAAAAQPLEARRARRRRRRSSSGSSGGSCAVVARRRARRLQRPGERPDDDRADGEAAERQQPGEQVEALLRRLGEHAGPELIDELGLDLAPRSSPAAMRSRMNAFIRRAIGRVGLVERRLAGRADDLAPRDRPGSALRAASAGAASASSASDSDDAASRPHGASPSASAMPALRSAPGCARCRSPPWIRSPTSRPRAVDEERLREAASRPTCRPSSLLPSWTTG